MEKLSNICLFAAAAENEKARYLPGSGGFFSSSLVHGLSTMPFTDQLWADSWLFPDGIVTYDELRRWLWDYPSRPGLGDWDGEIAYEMDFGDPVVFTSDMWSPAFFRSDDFAGQLATGAAAEPVPLPGATLLVVLGLSVAGYQFRRGN